VNPDVRAAKPRDYKFTLEAHSGKRFLQSTAKINRMQKAHAM
jgi:hypothetical protein